VALSTEQEIALYDILEVPYYATINRLSPPDNILATPITVDASQRQAKQRITDHLTAMTDAVETVLAAWLDAWITLGVDHTVIEVGQVGAIGGVTLNPEFERREIRNKVLNVVPFYRNHEEMERDKPGGGAFIPVTR